MKRIIILFVCTTLMTCSITNAQELREIQIGGSYAMTPQLTGGQGLIKASGPGFYSIIHFEIGSDLTISLAGGYNSISIEQDDAVEQWNWPFWQRFYRNYTRSLVSTDSNYTVTMTPNQHIYTIPVVISLNYYLPLESVIQPFISIGGGMVFYERNLRLNEVWTKYYPETGGTFQYEYDNHAGSKTGNAFLIRAAIGIESRFTEFFGLSFDISYSKYYIRANDLDFPLQDNLNLAMGLVFYY